MPDAPAAPNRLTRFLRIAVPAVVLGVLVAGVGLLILRQVIEQGIAESAERERIAGESLKATTEGSEASAEVAEGNPRREIGPPASMEEALSKGSLTWLLDEGLITRDDIDAWLTENQRSAQSLVAAWQLTGDDSFLGEAVERHPEDELSWFALLNSGTVTDEERAEVLAKYQEAQPDSAIANYLLASMLSKNGDLQAAFELARGAADKRFDFRDLRLQQSHVVREALQDFGQEPDQAAVMALFPQPQDTLIHMPRMGLVQFAKSEEYPLADREEALRLLYDLGERMAGEQEGSILTETMVATMLQAVALNNLKKIDEDRSVIADPDARLAELQTESNNMKALVNEWMERNPLPIEAYGPYIKKLETAGEAAAMQWVVDTYEPYPQAE